MKKKYAVSYRLFNLFECESLINSVILKLTHKFWTFLQQQSPEPILELDNWYFTALT